MGEGKNFFSREKKFFPSPPNPFQKKRGIFARVARKAYFINSSYLYSRSERFMFTERQTLHFAPAMLHAGFILLFTVCQRQTIFYKFIISLLAKRALHVCRTANASLCASNASRRIYPALHGLPTANHTSPTPFEKSEVFCRSACPPVARRATADCRGIVYSNSNAIIGKILSLLNGNRALFFNWKYNDYRSAFSIREPHTGV